MDWLCCGFDYTVNSWLAMGDKIEVPTKLGFGIGILNISVDLAVIPWYNMVTQLEKLKPKHRAGRKSYFIAEPVIRSHFERLIHLYWKTNSPWLYFVEFLRLVTRLGKK